MYIADKSPCFLACHKPPEEEGGAGIVSSFMGMQMKEIPFLDESRDVQMNIMTPCIMWSKQTRDVHPMLF